MTLGPSFEAAQRNRDRAVEVLTKTGFIVSQDKAQGPCSRLKYLGLEVCSSQLSFIIPEQKIEKILSLEIFTKLKSLECHLECDVANDYKKT